MTKPLTQQREKFCQEFAKHGNRTEAYRVAYPTSRKWTPSSVNSKASHLAADGTVKARLFELRGAVEKRVSKTREDWLEEVAFLAFDRKNVDQLAALVQYGKAQGYYEAVKVQVGKSGPSMVINVMAPSPEERAEIEAAAKAIETESVDLPTESAYVPSKNDNNP